MPGNVENLVREIENEPEWSPATAIMHDQILRQFTDKLATIAEQHPDRLTDAIGIVVQAGPGKACFILSDPAAQDLVDELQRLSDQGAPSPLADLAAARIPL